MSLEVDAFQEFLYVDEALQILIRFVRQMLPFCKEWKDRCVWFYLLPKNPHNLPINFCVFSFFPLEQKSSSPTTGTPLQRKKWCFSMGGSPKRSPVSHREVCSGRCYALKRQRETQRATCKDRVRDLETWHVFFERLECMMRTHLRMISNHILSAVSSIAG